MSSDEGTQELTFAQLYERLIIEDDVILDDMPAVQYPTLRKGLSSYKTKNNEKLKKNELPTEDRKIEFEILEHKKDGLLKVRVWFKPLMKISAKPIQTDGALK